MVHKILDAGFWILGGMALGIFLVVGSLLILTALTADWDCWALLSSYHL